MFYLEATFMCSEPSYWDRGRPRLPPVITGNLSATGAGEDARGPSKRVRFSAGNLPAKGLLL
jgi:hypothetical protein